MSLHQNESNQTNISTMAHNIEIIDLEGYSQDKVIGTVTMMATPKFVTPDFEGQSIEEPPMKGRKLHHLKNKPIMKQIQSTKAEDKIKEENPVQSVDIKP